MFPPLIVRLVVAAALCTSVSIAFDYDFLNFYIRHYDVAPIAITYKISRDRHKEYTYNATLLLKESLHGYDVTVKAYRSVLGNNQFILSPFQVPRTPVCNFFNEFREALLEEIGQYSNLPFSNDSKIDYCDLLQKGEQYALVNYVANPSNIPKYIPLGTYKVGIQIIDKTTNKVVAEAESITKLY